MTKISIQGWEATGFRCPDHKVDFTRSKSDVYRISLIQMPNGTGKTTTLNLLRWALSGRLSEWNPEVAELAGDSSSAGRFIIRLRIDDRQLTIELKVDFDEEKIAYLTTFGGTTQKEFKPPATLRQIFSEEFVDLFVFDGELAHALMNSEKTRAQQAMDAQFQLGLLAQISTRVENNWRRHADSVTATEQRGLKRRKNRLEKIRNRLDELRKRKATLELREGPARGKVSALRKKYDDLLGKDEKDAVELKRISEDLGKAEGQLTAATVTAISEIRNPQNLAEGFTKFLVDLKQNLDVLQLPESTSREFFDELKNAEECVCGRPIDTAAKMNIASKAESYLGSNEAGVLNIFKTDVTRFVSNPAESYVADLDRRMKQVASAVEQRDRLQTEKEAIEQRRLAAGDPELEGKKDEIETAETELKAIVDELENLNAPYTEDDDENTDSVVALKEVYDRAERDYAEITETIDLKNKTSIARNIIGKAQEIARSKISSSLCDATNHRISGVLRRTPITVARIDESVVLERQAGASVGQTLSVGYAFLGSLFGMGAFELPFVVDSPAGPLDDNVRREIAGIVPDFTHQFIAFVISSERPNFVEPLRRAAEGEVQHFTLFRLIPDTESMKNDAKRYKAIESDNGVLVEAQEYFDRFDDSELERHETQGHEAA